LILQIPVRCHTCFERVHASVFSAWDLALARWTARKRMKRARRESKMNEDSAIA